MALCGDLQGIYYITIKQIENKERNTRIYNSSEITVGQESQWKIRLIENERLSHFKRSKQRVSTMEEMQRPVTTIMMQEEDGKVPIYPVAAVFVVAATAADDYE